MKRLIVILYVLISSTAGKLHAQFVYPEKYDQCYLDEFKFETDKILAKIDDQKLIETITLGWSKKMKTEAEGNLGLQILVDRRGQSCLVSLRNDTNLKVKKMNLSKNINNNLKWSRMSDKISAIILLQFNEGEITLKRLGTEDMVNLLEIKRE